MSIWSNVVSIGGGTDEGVVVMLNPIRDFILVDCEVIVDEFIIMGG